MQQNNSGMNTVLLVIILVTIVGAVTWFFATQIDSTEQNEASFGVDVTVPSGSNENE